MEDMSLKMTLEGQADTLYNEDEDESDLSSDEDDSQDEDSELSDPSSDSSDDEELSTPKQLHDYLLRRIQSVYRSIRRGDLSLMLSDDVPVFVDGDTLLLTAFNNSNYDGKSGGQTLHLIYIYEQFLNLFYHKCKKFVLFFVDGWEQVWEEQPDLLLARSILINHFKLNTNFPVITLPSYSHKKFKDLVIEMNPSFFLTNFLTCFSPDKQMVTYSSEFLFAFSLGLRLVRVVSVDLKNGAIVGSFIEGKCLSKKTAKLSQALKRVNHQERLNSSSKYVCNFIHSDYRRYVCVNACSILAQMGVAKDWMRCFVFYNTLVDSLPLQQRAVDSISDDARNFCNSFIVKVVEAMLCVVRWHSEKGPVLPDLWNGNFFTRVFLYLQKNKNVTELPFYPVYLSYMDDLNLVLTDKISPSPLLETLNFSESVTAIAPNSRSVHHILTTDKFINEFCVEVIQSLSSDKSVQHSSSLENNSVAHSESGYWETDTQISHEFARLKQEAPVPTDPKQRAMHLRYQNFFSKFQDIYGASMEGRNYVSKPIIVKAQKSKNVKKEKGPGKKAQKIIEDNEKQKKTKQEEEDMKKFSKFEGSNWKLSYKQNFALALREINLLIDGCKSDVVYSRALIIKLEILYLLWSDSCGKRKNLTYVDEFLLTLQKLIKLVLLDNTSQNNNNKNKSTNRTLNEKERVKLGKFLYEMGFNSLAKKWNFPKPDSVSNKYTTGMSLVRYQLTRLGPHMDRDMGGVPDSRADGFIPDPWQSALFDVVDKKESALIVAPTSSGKTYAMYYCMEKVLTEGDDGIVVYVAPTKALVNQVAATVYTRFKKKVMPPGKSVYGVFTKEYGYNVMNSQILITVPAVLEILLLSPMTQGWVSKIQYVVFDEVHSLANCVEGITWERCFLLIPSPFLALSATINSPSDLRDWLEEMQKCKKDHDVLHARSHRVHLVVHQDRHSDLKKFVFSENSITHAHPYAFLEANSMKAHKGVPDGLQLSPEETLQLFDVMQRLGPMKDVVLEDIFDSAEFITRPKVREFEKTLKIKMKDIFYSKPEMFKNIVSSFNTSEKFVALNSQKLTVDLIKLIESMIKQDMFPAIFFSYDRSLIDNMLIKSSEYYNNLTEDSIDIRDLKKQAKLEKKEKKAREAEEGKNVNEAKRNTKASVNLLEDSMSPLRGKGVADKDDIKFIENRLSRQGVRLKSVISNGYRHGFGKHYEALSRSVRLATEVLFRLKVVNCVYATGTLALGIHTPCKTVVIIGDNSQLNSLEFQQMSGRAGRRGFDDVGNVIIHGISYLRTRSLLTSSLINMTGFFPIDVTFVSRVMVFLRGPSHHSGYSESEQKFVSGRTSVLLSSSLLYRSLPTLKWQMRYFFYFANQFLIKQKLLSVDGEPEPLLNMITNLPTRDPGNFALMHLFMTGELRRLCTLNQTGQISFESLKNLMIVLNFLLIREPVSLAAVISKKPNSRTGVLPDLPISIHKRLVEYNEKTQDVFYSFYQILSDNLGAQHDTLPLSRVDFYSQINVNNVLDADVQKRNICSSFAAMSGASDENIFDLKDDISCIRDDIHTKRESLPLLNLDVHINSYAFDFFNHGSRKRICVENRLKEGENYTKLMFFGIHLNSVTRTLRELRPTSKDDILLEAFETLSSRFVSSFVKAFDNNPF